MTGRLRIAMVALDFHRKGGSENRTGHLVDALQRLGHEVHLIGARIQGNWDPAVRQHPVAATARPRWVNVLQFSRRAARLLERERFDLVHNQIRPFVPGIVTVGGGCHRYYLERVLPREKGPVAARLKLCSPLHRVLLALERHAFRPDGCPFVIANSRLGRDGVLDSYPLPVERIGVAYNGVDAARFSPDLRKEAGQAQRAVLGIGPDELLVLFVGSGFARKGLGPLMTAVGRLGRKGIRPVLVVAGGSPQRRWRRRAAEAGLADRVRFVGHVANPEVFYAAADVFALPTFFDPFANATLEAMASGLPVITSRHNGAAEILEAGTDGLVIDSADDVGPLADALASLTDGPRRQAMGAAARATALRFPWQASIDATVAVYGKLLGRDLHPTTLPPSS
jgi:UDP-glucose:(heptosyl)LPS alpha-1,3-glucosyltransferase